MAQGDLETVLAYPARLTREWEGGFTVTFRDLPEAITYGADEEKAAAMAAEVLELAVCERMDRSEDIPSASPAESGEALVTMRPLLAAKVALHCALGRNRISKSDLARRLGVDEAVVRRMLQPRRASRIDNVAQALAILGISLQVTAVAPKASGSEVGTPQMSVRTLV